MYLGSISLFTINQLHFIADYGFVKINHDLFYPNMGSWLIENNLSKNHVTSTSFLSKYAQQLEEGMAIATWPSLDSVIVVGSICQVPSSAAYRMMVSNRDVAS